MQYIKVTNRIKTSLSPSEAYLYMVVQTFKSGTNKTNVIKIQTIAERAGYTYQVTKNMLSSIYEKLGIKRQRTRFKGGEKDGYLGFCEWEFDSSESNFTMIQFDIVLSNDLDSMTKFFYMAFKSILHNWCYVNKMDTTNGEFLVS